MLAATRTSGVNGIHRLRHEMDRLFGAVFPAFVPFETSTFPALAIWEEQDQLTLEAELPGLKLEDLDISLVNKDLTIRGERKPQVADGAAILERGRWTGKFERTVRLPFEVDAEKVSANLSNGVLTVTLPKAEVAKPRKIAVQVG